MKKRTAPTQTEATDSPASSTTLTARFSEAERQTIERAAKVLGCSPAKLLKDASVRRAVDVLNADGPNRTALRRISDELVKDVFDPMIEVSSYGPRDTLRARFSDDDIQEAFSNSGASVHGWDAARVGQVTSALRTSATEFAALLAESFTRILAEMHPEAQAYAPVVVLLDGATEDQEGTK